MKLFDGYFKKDIDNNVLLSKGGNKALADFVGSLYFDDETNTLQYKSAIDTTYTNLFQLGARAFDSTEYLPLSGGTVTGIITGNTGNGIEFQSANTGTWKEGIRIYPASNGYAVCSLQSKDSRQVLSLVMNESSGARYIDNCINGTTYAINIPHKSGTLALTSDISNNSGPGSEYVFNSGDLPQNGNNIASYNTAHKMTFYRNAIMMPYQMDNANDGGFIRSRGTSEYSTIFEIGMWDDSGAGETIQFNYYPTTSTISPTYSISVPKKSGTIALTNDISWSNVSGRPFEGAGSDYASWGFNPLGATDQAWITGFAVRNSSLSSDWGCLRYYLSRNTPGGGELSVCMDIDGFICTPGSMYAGSGFYTGSDIRLKKNIKNINDVNMLPVKLFDLRSNNLHSYGFIALELELLGLKELVINGDPYKSVNYNAALSLCIALLLNIIKNMEKRIKILEANQAPQNVK